MSDAEREKLKAERQQARRRQEREARETRRPTKTIYVGKDLDVPVTVEDREVIRDMLAGEDP